jgi:RHS repeat-associated protein
MDSARDIAEPGKTYQYDAEGRMISVNSGAVATYVYNAEGERVRKTAGGVTTEYIRDLGGQVVAERVGSTWTIGYVYLNGQLLAQYSNGTTYFAHKDHLGSTRLLTKLDRSVQECTDYLPFGEQRTDVCVTAGASTTTHKFTGHERDSETGLDFMGARYYASNYGRFGQVDPSAVGVKLLTPQSWNRYTYAANNPLAYVDRNGKWPTSFHHALIEEIFTGELTIHQRGVLKGADAYVDSDQSIQGAYKHGMSGPGREDDTDSANASLEFISENFETAVYYQLLHEEKGGEGYSDTALFFFGIALHTATDSVSPSHEGAQDWHGTAYPWTRHPWTEFKTFISNPFREARAGVHVLRESNFLEKEMARNLARARARELWKAFKARLDAERAKRKKEEEEKKEKEKQEETTG